MSEDEKPLWGIGAIGLAIAWVEQLLTVLSAPLLTFVAVLTVASAFQGGKLIEDSPMLTQAYSWSIGIGIEGQLAGMAYNARKAAVNGHGAASFGYWVATLVLYVIGVLTGGIIAYQNANQVSFNAALQAVGVPLFLWDWGRVVVMFGLIVLAASTRYVKPKPRLSLEEELAEIERQAKLTQAKTAFNAQKIRGFAGAFKGAIDGVRGVEEAHQTPDIAPALAQVIPEETPDHTTVFAASEPAPLDLKLRGKWWDAPSFKAYVYFAHGVGISDDKALEIVRTIGNEQRTSERVGRPFIGGIVKLKNEARRIYGPVKAPEMAGAFAEQMAE